MQGLRLCKAKVDETSCKVRVMQDYDVCDAIQGQGFARLEDLDMYND